MLISEKDLYLLSRAKFLITTKFVLKVIGKIINESREVGRQALGLVEVDTSGISTTQK